MRFFAFRGRGHHGAEFLEEIAREFLGRRIDQTPAELGELAADLRIDRVSQDCGFTIRFECDFRAAFGKTGSAARTCSRVMSKSMMSLLSVIPASLVLNVRRATGWAFGRLASAAGSRISTCVIPGPRQPADGEQAVGAGLHRDPEAFPAAVGGLPLEVLHGGVGDRMDEEVDRAETEIGFRGDFSHHQVRAVRLQFVEQAKRGFAGSWS